MRTEASQKLDRFREKALARGVPADAVERWLASARPCVTLAPGADGPVVGRLGGPVMLPADVPGLSRRLHLIATLDLTALPQGATGLRLPSDGRLLLFAHADPENCEASGRVVYVPAGAPVEERRVDHGYEPDDAMADLDVRLAELGELRLAHDVSLPDHEVLFDPSEHPHARELRAAWDDVRYADWKQLGGGHLQIDGYATDPYGEDDPVTACQLHAQRREDVDDGHGEEGRRPSPWEAPRPGDWALLGQWHGLVDGVLYWTATRQDVSECRFDRTTVLGFFEGPF
ncbi:DUF1963 domain-containing protein [Streptomyces sp. NBC_00059]|uniref:DUF1963 domain-containing protein n=1 Tax=Streptomyces sp. NBC_00059 TaxID=2975635 RepID=UPI002259DD51|nr:DUF1963 domain-containing protein [Streptomyces sp. NBC_00059]MCX5410911.1 DUF1963 domain-containing protein [Streptomyces sp. NBC_00059]